jgi:hypothetical protein
MSTIVGIEPDQHSGPQGRRGTDGANNRLPRRFQLMWLNQPCDRQGWAHRVETSGDEGFDGMREGGGPPFVQLKPEQRGWPNSGLGDIESAAHPLASSSRRKASLTRQGGIPSMNPVPGTSLP